MNKLLIPISCCLFLFGCVNQKKYDDLRNRYSILHSDNEGCKNELALTKARLRGSKNFNGKIDNIIDNKNKEINSLKQSLSKCIEGDAKNIYNLANEIDQSNKYIKHLINAKNKSDSLNKVLKDKLTRSLSNEDLNDVNIKVLKGVVYISLSDNMLYKSGSYQVSNSGHHILQKIAKIINDYNDYDVLVEGNTDNVPILKPNIRNNWDLSVLRASSVVQILQNKYNVDPKRMTAGGRGQYNPVASNLTKYGKSKNRRTEIIILPKLDQFMALLNRKLN